MTPRTALALWVGLGGLAAAVLVHVARRVNARAGWIRPNYLGVGLPAFCGIAFPALGVLCVAGLPLARLAGIESRTVWLLLGGTMCFGALGLADDLWGSERIRGLRGHLRALLVERQVTTGFLKLSVGAAAAVVLGALACGPGVLPSLVAAAVIALSANAVNLLDTRPGRAPWMAALALTALFVAAFARGHDSALSAGFPLWPFLIAAEAMALADGARLSMMGDVGSNSLGAVIGIGVVLSTGLHIQVAIAVILLVLNLIADRYSLSAWLERDRP